ncbi:SCO3242 family prenyltransferase [Streptomyces sp. 7-21]|uniref:SCO3242 family prenyltransferase n=1 Tax=Streptomyces sp. 7-21 TaxID=2802283 RepID=UPI0019203415|nr:UbiA family prenyltransferase [Streptomyces sp. 7-21]MBL1067787.1 UbiA family prenyltransferase [Streptomyces sp. 7-21]
MSRSTLPSPRDIADLIRAPAALTVPGDSLAGAAAAGFPYGRRTWLTPLASACLYWAGMALNDYADRDLDRAERPERPLPSGRVTPGQALGISVGLTAAGLGLAAAAGGRTALRTAVPLAATVWAYDLAAKPTAAGPAAMAAARGLDVLLGAGPHWRRAALPAAALAVHTAGVTLLSRGEVHGTSRRTAGAAALCTAGAAAAAGAPLPAGTGDRPRPPAGSGAVARWRGAAADPGRGRARRLAALAAALPGAGRRGSGAGQRPGTGRAAAALAAVYGATVGRAQLTAAARPDAPTVRAATGTGIRGMIPLQSALIARAGAPALALTLAAAVPLARAASKVVSET